MYSSSLAMNSSRSGTGRMAPSPSNTSARPSTPRRSNSQEMDFIIGDRVLVGNKPGIIAYLGDVKFAAGDFAGVVLDEAAGKNDGSMKGTRYFQCEPLKGVFIRTSKLVRNTTVVSPTTRASPRSNTAQSLSTPTRSSASRSKSTSSTSSVPPAAEDTSSSPILDTACNSTECQVKTGEQMQKIQKEYEGLMAGTRQKFEEFQLHIEKLEKENGELHKTIDEQKAKIEDLQFQLEEEVLSKEDVMQELVNTQNNNHSVQTSTESSGDVRAMELHRQLDDSLQVNSSLREELDQVKAQLSDIEFQLAENESEKDNEIKEKKRLEDLISKLKSQSASKAAATNQSESSLSTQSVTLLNQQLTDKTSQLETLQRNYSKLEEKVRQLLEKISAIESQHNNDKQSFSQSQDSLLNQHKIDIDKIRDDHSKELHRHQKKHTENTDSLQKKHELATQQLNSQHGVELTSLQKQLQTLGTDYTKLSTESSSCNKCTAYKSQLNELRRQATEVEASRDEQLHRLSSQVSSLTTERQRLNNTIDSKSQLVQKLKQQMLDTQQQLSSWQQEVKGQVESNRQQSEQDLERLRIELESSQTLLEQLERKLSLSEKENCKLESRVKVLSNELHHMKKALVASSPRGTDGCNGTYRDTSDFLFNELRHQIEVMELNVLKTSEEDQRLKEENELLKSELSQARHDLGSRRNSRRNSLPRLFCDTCGAFDLHPTTQCSRAHSTVSSSQSNMMHGSNKQPHCNICSSQGHWTADCTIDE